MGEVGPEPWRRPLCADRSGRRLARCAPAPAGPARSASGLSERAARPGPGALAPQARGDNRAFSAGDSVQESQGFGGQIQRNAEAVTASLARRLRAPAPAIRRRPNGFPGAEKVRPWGGAEPRASPDRATGRECRGLVENRIEDIHATRESEKVRPIDTTRAKRATEYRAATQSGAAVWGWVGAVGGGGDASRDKFGGRGASGEFGAGCRSRERTKMISSSSTRAIETAGRRPVHFPP